MHAGLVVIVGLSQPVSLGLKFQTTSAANLTAIRFFKADKEKGSGHTFGVIDWHTGTSQAADNLR